MNCPCAKCSSADIDLEFQVFLVPEPVVWLFARNVEVFMQ